MVGRGYSSQVVGNRSLWIVALLVFMVVAVPAGCVVWFMNQAMSSQHLAVRQRLTNVYRSQLLAVRPKVAEYWAERLDAVAKAGPRAGETAGQTFARLVADGVADSMLVYDAAGRLAYPAEQVVIEDQAGGAQARVWRRAEALEYERGDILEAAEAYAGLASQADNLSIKARALMARARCLARAGRTDEPIGLLSEMMVDARYEEATDALGRPVVPTIRLRVLELLGDPTSPEFVACARALFEYLNSYAHETLPSSQRVFCRQRVRELWTGCPSFATGRAEQIATRVLDAGGPVGHSGRSAAVMLLGTWFKGQGARRPESALLPGLWLTASADGRVVAIFERDTVAARTQRVLDQTPLPAGVFMRVVPASDAGQTDAALSVGVGDALPGWRLAMHVDGAMYFDEVASRQRAAYWWTGVLAVVFIVLVTAVAGGYVGRQMRLTRLKSNLIATVSHELKTPLSGMRVLVDTLLAGRCRDDRQATEYLELIAKENERLSCLIDNFLTFSRMERNRWVFEREPICIRDAVAKAREAMGERLGGQDCRFAADVAPDLPTVIGDFDAVVTVILNLLDNAHKYTDQNKQIDLRVWAEDSWVCIDVRDNGIGLSRRATRRVFDRFYQVDQTLSRHARGCGLGLSIVKFIVDAHGGSVGVVSHLGQGSTFTVKLPAAAAPGATMGQGQADAG